jgi:hypothetical protein
VSREMRAEFLARKWRGGGATKKGTITDGTEFTDEISDSIFISAKSVAPVVNNPQENG